MPFLLYSVPILITKLSRAASTTSTVTTCIPFICSILSICVHNRCSSRKLPPVIRMIAASASMSVKSSTRNVHPSPRFAHAHFCVRIKCISAGLSALNPCTNPTREYN